MSRKLNKRPDGGAQHVIKEGWQPIETAPKDGSEILIYCGAPWAKIEKAKWYAPWANWLTGNFPVDPARESGTYGIGSFVPTHWMPLPTPPTMEESK